MARQYFLALLSGALVLMAFPPIALSWMAWVGILPFLWALQKAPNLRHSIGLGFSFGLVFMGGFHSWIWELSQFGPIWGIIGLWGLYSLYLASFYALFGALAYFLRHKRDSLYAVGMSSVFVLTEALRQFGPIGSPGGILGYSQTESSFAPLASWTGVSGVSFIVILLSTVIASITYKRILTAPKLAIGLLLSLLIGSYLISPPVAGKQVIAGSIQGIHSQQSKLTPSNSQDIQDFYLRETKKAIQKGATLIVWPETITPQLNTHNPRLMSQLHALLPPNTVLLWGTPLWEKEKFYNSIVLTTQHTGIKERYQKHRLVPFGEYWPLKSWFQKLGLENLIPGAEYSAGPPPKIIFSNYFSGAICLESIYGAHFRSQVQAGSQGFVISGNHGWYGRSSAAAKHLDILRFRAMEYQRSIIFATTNGISALILPNGQCKARAEAHQEAVLIGAIPLQTTLTPYVKYSEWFLGILLLTYCGIYTGCKIQSQMR